MLGKTLLVAQREFMENLRTKAFWIGILVFPVILVMAVAVPTLLEMSRAARQYAVIDHSGWLLEAIEQQSTASDLEQVLTTALNRHDRHQADTIDLDAVTRLHQPLEQVLLALLELEGRLEPPGPGPEGDDEAQPEVSPIRTRLVERLASLAADPESPAPAESAFAEAVEQELAVHAQTLREWWSTVTPKKAEALGWGLDRSRAVRVDIPGQGETLEDELRRRVGEGELFAYLVIPEDPMAAARTAPQPDPTGLSGEAPPAEPAVPCRYVASNLTDEELRDWFTRTASQVLRRELLEAEGLDPQLARWIRRPVELEVQKLAKTGDVSEVEAHDTIRQWAPVAFVYLLWIAIFSIAQMLLTNTIEEKSNRIMEVLLSSVSPLQLMVGKIFGIAATGLTVVGSWMFFFWGGVSLIPMLLGLNTSATLGLDLGKIASDPFYVGGFLVYFLLGYLFYASLLVGIGAVCNSLKEAQNLMTPITIVLMVPLLSMMPIGKDPNGLLAKIMSFIPPFTPFVMMNRAAAPPTPMEYLLTTLLLVVSIALVMWAAAKVFRIGILMTGKPPKITEILRWLKAPVGSVPARRGENGS